MVMIWDKMNGSLSKEIDMNGNDDSTAKVKKNISALRLYRIQQKENIPPPYQGPPKKYMGGEYDEKEELTLSSDISTLPGLKSGYPLDILSRSIMYGKQAELKRQEAVMASTRITYEKAKPLIGKALSEDYAKDSISSALGAPVDLANTLLSLLGIEMEQKPFLGSDYIRESLDKPPYRYEHWIRPKAKSE